MTVGTYCRDKRVPNYNFKQFDDLQNLVYIGAISGCLNIIQITVLVDTDGYTPFQNFAWIADKAQITMLEMTFIILYEHLGNIFLFSRVVCCYKEQACSWVKRAQDHPRYNIW